MKTSYTERLGEYLIVVSPAEGYTIEDGILTVEVLHNTKGLIECHTDRGDIKDFIEHGKQYVLDCMAYLVIGEENITPLAVHNNLVLAEDSTDYLVINHDGFVYGRFATYAEVRAYSMNNSYKGFSKWFNRNDIHHAMELV